MPSFLPSLLPSQIPSFAPTEPGDTPRPTAAPTPVKISELEFNVTVLVKLENSTNSTDDSTNSTDDLTRSRHRKLLNCEEGLSPSQQQAYEEGSANFLCAEIEGDLEPQEELVLCQVEVTSSFCVVIGGDEYFAIDFDYFVTIASPDRNTEEIREEVISAPEIEELITVNSEEYTVALAAAGVDMEGATDEVFVIVEEIIAPEKPPEVVEQTNSSNTGAIAGERVCVFAQNHHRLIQLN